MKKKRVYIAGAISNDPNYKEKFDRAQAELEEHGYTVINPAKTPLDPEQFTNSEYLEVCRVYVKLCDAVYFLNDWQTSLGATLEYAWAGQHGKQRMFQDRHE